MYILSYILILILILILTKMKQMILLFKKERENHKGWDTYYSTGYRDVFIHHFWEEDEHFFSAERIIRRGETLVMVERKVVDIFGGVQSISHLSRKSLTEALRDARTLSRRKREGKTVGIARYSNEKLFNEINNMLMMV